MSEIPNHALQPQVERIRALVGPLAQATDAPISPLLTATLFDFYITTKEKHCLLAAGEIARSLASLLHYCGEQAPNEQERLQVTVMAGNLLQELSPQNPSAHPEQLRPLVTPIAPSSATVNHRIALYVDSGVLSVMLRETLSQAGFEPVNVDSLDALAAIDAAHFPAAIIADLSLCQLHPQSAAVFAELRRRFSPPPHLFCIAASNDIPARLEAVRLGATRFLSQPVDTARLIAILKGVTAQVPTKPFRVVMVDDDPLLGELYDEVLKEAGVSTRVVADPLLAPDVIAEFQPDLIVCDIFMPGCNGFELLSLLRQDDSLADTPIVLLSSEQEAGRRLEALNLGADDFLTKPVDVSLLLSTVIARAKRARMLKRSRSEYSRILQRMREMEPYLPENFPGMPETDMELNLFFPETINMDDYVVREVPRDGQ